MAVPNHQLANRLLPHARTPVTAGVLLAAADVSEPITLMVELDGDDALRHAKASVDVAVTAAANTSDTEALAKFAGDPRKKVRRAVASNPKAPLDVLSTLWERETAKGADEVIAKSLGAVLPAQELFTHDGEHYVPHHLSAVKPFTKRIRCGADRDEIEIALGSDQPDCAAGALRAVIDGLVEDMTVSQAVALIHRAVKPGAFVRICAETERLSDELAAHLTDPVSVGAFVECAASARICYLSPQGVALGRMFVEQLIAEPTEDRIRFACLYGHLGEDLLADRELCADLGDMLVAREAVARYADLASSFVAHLRPATVTVIVGELLAHMVKHRWTHRGTGSLARALVESEHPFTQIDLVGLLLATYAASFIQLWLDGEIRHRHPRHGEVTRLFATMEDIGWTPDRSFCRYEHTPILVDLCRYRKMKMYRVADKPWAGEMLDAFGNHVFSMIEVTSSAYEVMCRIATERLGDDPELWQTLLTMAPEWEGNTSELIELIRALFGVEDVEEEPEPEIETVVSDDGQLALVF